MVKGYPLGLELMAILGSEKADKKLTTADEINYKGYKDSVYNTENILLDAGGMAGDHFKLMAYWLSRGKQVQDNDSRRLNTCLAFWTYDSYISQLYTKQSYTAMGKGFSMPSRKRTVAWLEPAPHLYQLLEARILHFQSIAADEKKLSEMLESYNDILKRCQNISEQEIAKQPLAAADIDFLNTLDVTLFSLLYQRDLPIVVDVHTEPTAGKVLEEGVGYPGVIEKKMGDETLRGALFSYYEFKYPMDDRLTDEKWRSLLATPEQMKTIQFSPGTTDGKNQAIQK